MGMGKTLSILALLTRTLEAAQEWASTLSNEVGFSDNPVADSPHVKKSKSTLIIASQDLMINEWLQEIDRHFDHRNDKGLTIIKYHGQGRETNIEKLRNADVVITTYHTLASDFLGKRNYAKGTRNPLKDIEWYRLVLDEGETPL
jgi:SNF2 family DNA or RNA helicase